MTGGGGVSSASGTSGSSSGVNGGSSGSSGGSCGGGYVCVGCSHHIESLFVEYSERNFRLTRCSHCSQVADKYIEFELLLVLIDVVLHRKPAYRHLMFNRYHPVVGERASRWVPFIVLLIGVVLKLAVLRHTIYHQLYLSSILHALLTTLVETVLFTAVLVVWAAYVTGFQSIDGQYVRSYSRLYLSVLFPEAFRVISIMLHIFDAEPELLVLLSALIFSMQCQSYVTNTALRGASLAPGLLLAALLRFLWQRAVYPGEELWELGVFT